MIETLKNLCQDTLSRIKSASNSDALECVRVDVLGRKGAFRRILPAMKDVSKEDKPEVGRVLNEVRSAIDAAFVEKSKAFLGNLKKSKTSKKVFDYSLPGEQTQRGHKHPLTVVLDEIRHIFLKLGFSVAEGPEVEFERYNFDALNIPSDHPARDGFDTFYPSLGVVLRSQTSTTQIRTMEKKSPPIRIIAPGRCYRPDEVDATHHYCFHQFEGLMLDDKTTFADLKYVLSFFAHEMFGADTETRFRPSFFPFTEPSAEVDVSCPFCKRSGCRICKQSGWIEIGGCGMVDPNVLTNVNIDPETYTGFAFGFGVERVAMMRYQIPDIRLFLQNDVRFLSQFS